MFNVFEICLLTIYIWCVRMDISPCTGIMDFVETVPIDSDTYCCESSNLKLNPHIKVSVFYTLFLSCINNVFIHT